MKQLTKRWLEAEEALLNKATTFEIDGEEVSREEFLAYLDELGAVEMEEECMKEDTVYGQCN